MIVNAPRRFFRPSASRSRPVRLLGRARSRRAALERGGRKLGGIGVLRLEDLTWVAELPFPGYSPATGQVGTYNPMHLDVTDGRLRLHLLPDQDRAAIFTWSTPVLP